jgi:two-component system sensor histidine kinase KdpD
MKINANDRYSYQGAIRGPLKNYAWSVLSILAVTVFGYVLTPHLDLTNIALLYLLPVLISAVSWGRGPAFLASFLGVLAFNFFFVPPIFTFEVANVQHFFALVIFLLVALVTSTLATKLRDEMHKATEREQRTLALYDLSREIAARTDLDQVLKTFVDKVADTINGGAIVLIHNEDANTLDQIASTGTDGLFDEKEYAVARRVLEQGRPVGKGLGIFEGERSLFFFPVKVEDRTLAVLGIRPGNVASSLSPEQTQLIETLSNLAAVIIVRLQLAKEAEHAKWLAESEKLHRTLLNSISHDFRTPLAAIMGAVTSLIDEKDIIRLRPGRCS